MELLEVKGVVLFFLWDCFQTTIYPYITFKELIDGSIDH